MNVDRSPGRSARAMWAASEPFTLGLLVHADGRESLVRLGVPQQAAYFAVRAAPLGQASPAVVAAALHGFPVAALTAVLPDVWEHVTPTAVTEAHHDSLAATAARVFDDIVTIDDVRRVADLLTPLCERVDTSGRPLAAGNQALPAPSEPWARLWQACNTLREYRGDAHVAALVVADLTVAESLLLTSVWGGDSIDTTMLRRTRQLSDELWRDAHDALTQRHLLTAGGKLSPAGRALREDIETRTDLASSRPWSELGDRDLRDVYNFLTALSTHMIDTGAIRPVTPVGAPWPPPPLIS